MDDCTPTDARRHHWGRIWIGSFVVGVFLTIWSTVSETPSGRLRHLKPAVQLSETPPYWARPSVPLGYHRPVWP